MMVFAKEVNKRLGLQRNLTSRRKDEATHAVSVGEAFGERQHEGEWIDALREPQGSTRPGCCVSVGPCEHVRACRS